MSKAETFLYFGFGSNLLKERLRLNNPSAIYKTTAKLEKYKLTFWSNKDPSSSRWGGSVANIEEDDSSSVWGTVWELNTKDIPSLDRQEGAYEPIEVEVVTEENIRHKCRTYQIQTKGKLCKWPTIPSPQYMDVIIRGAIQSDLPKEYIGNLRKIEHNGFSGKVEVYEKTLKMLENGSKSGGD